MKTDEVRLALITDWGAPCGIASYSKYLVDALSPKIADLKIFSEINESTVQKEEKYSVDYCWKRGENLKELIAKVKAYNPSSILIQHEFGLFPKASYFLKMLEQFSEIPLSATMHSVYEHLDKSVQSSFLKNVIVHSKEAQDCLKYKLGHLSQRSWVINHGCIDLQQEAAFNPFGTQRVLMQFGFAFPYKGLETTLHSIALLKKRNPKFEDIVYIFLASENPHTMNAHSNYIGKLKQIAKDLNVEDNFILKRGFFSDQEINQYLRTTRLSVFAYQTDPSNIVRGASGAIRIAMTSPNPVIASKSPMFDDLEGVIPRCEDSESLANEIAKCFADGQYRKQLVDKQRAYIKNNTWEITAGRYKDVLLEIQNQT